MAEHSSIWCGCTTCWDSSETRAEWLKEAARTICETGSAEEELTYRRRAAAVGASLYLDSAILQHTINSAASAELLHLVQHIQLLTVYLTGDLTCAIESTEDVRLHFKAGLEQRTAALSEDRSKLLQLNALIKAFLETALSRAVPLAATACEKFSIGDNVALVFPLFGDSRSDSDDTATFALMDQLGTKSSALKAENWPPSKVKHRIRHLLESTRLGLKTPVLDLPKPLSEALSVQSHHVFRAYCAHALRWAWDLTSGWTKVPLLLLFSHALPTHQRKNVANWIQSQAGQLTVHHWTIILKDERARMSPTQRSLLRAGVWIAQQWRNGLMNTAPDLTEENLERGTEELTDGNDGAVFVGMIQSDMARELEVMRKEQKQADFGHPDVL